MTTTPRAWSKNLELARPFDFVEVALGLHPQLVGTHFNDLALWVKLLEETRFVGEVGLDASPKHYRSFEKQKQVFETVLRSCATQGNKVLSVHSVRAGKTVLDMVEAHLKPSDCQVILHWFTGSRSEALRAVDLGCYFSINQEMLQAKHHLDMIRALPKDRLLTETDGPFTSCSGMPCQPNSVLNAITELAMVRGMTTEEARLVVCSNYQVLLA
jgi:TatD DNase family protein